MKSIPKIRQVMIILYLTMFFIISLFKKKVVFKIF